MRLCRCVCQGVLLLCTGVHEKLRMSVLRVCQSVRVNVRVSVGVCMCRDALAHCILGFTFLA